MSDASKLPVRKGLGRGLGSLIPGGSEPAKPAVVEPTPAELAAAADAEKVRRAVIDVSVELIDAMPNQPRLRFDDDGIRELAASIAESGIIQPLVVRTLPEGRYSLIAGERRLRASKLAGLTQVPVVVHEAADAEAFRWRSSRMCSGATSTRSRGRRLPASHDRLRHDAGSGG